MAGLRARTICFSLLFLGSFLITSLPGQMVDRVPNGEELPPIPTAPNVPLENEQPEILPPPPSVPDEVPYMGEACMDLPCGEDDCAMFCGMPCCSPPERFWFRGEYIMWWTSGSSLPPLAISSPIGTTPPAGEVIYGNQRVLGGGRSNVRLALGGWLDCCHCWGIEADWYTVGGLSTHFEQSATVGTHLSRPFYNVQINGADAELADSIAVDAEDYFDSTGVWFRYNLCCCEDCCAPCGDDCGGSCGDAGCGEAYCDESDCGDYCGPWGLFCCRTDLLVGYRFYGLSDHLSIHEDVHSPELEASFSITDTFRTRNEFHGIDIGLSTDIYRGCWGLNLLAKVAIGGTRQIAYIDGYTRITQDGQSVEYGNGIYATRGNIGAHSHEVFTMIPQLGVELSYQLTCRVRGFLGYNILYWAPIWRAGNQVDWYIDPRNWPPPETGALPFPRFPGECDNFWAQGINLGAEIRF